MRAGGIWTFTEADFLLNQSRLFPENGGDIVMTSKASPSIVTVVPIGPASDGCPPDAKTCPR